MKRQEKYPGSFSKKENLKRTQSSLTWIRRQHGPFYRGENGPQFNDIGAYNGGTARAREIFTSRC